MSAKPSMPRYPLSTFMLGPYRRLQISSMLGVQVVVEDYVGSEPVKLVLQLRVKVAHAVLGVAAIFAVLKVALGG